MKKLNSDQSGFGHVLLVLVVLLVCIIGFVGYKTFNKAGGGSNTNRSSNTTTKTGSTVEAQPSLQNLGLASFDSVDFTENAVREYSSMGLKGFYGFGEKLGGKTDTRLNPNFEYASLKKGSKVISAIDGVVAFINYQADSKDSEVFIQPIEGSVWTIGYDHISSVAVKKDAAIKAGDVIGEPAVQNNGLFRFELQINKDENNTTTHYCPSTLLAAGVADKWLGELKTMQNKWESTTGLELYDLASQNPVGCTTKTLTPEQAEGN